MGMIPKIMAMEKKVKIINQLALNGFLSRSELMRLTKYPRSTLYDNLKVLKRDKIVEQFRDPHHNGKHGRPVVYWRLVEGAD